MTRYTETETAHIYGQMIGATMQPVDQAKAVAAYRYAKHRGEVPIFLKVWSEKRRDWRNWVAVTQRQWQRHTRRPSRARHHDSISIREKYVRCSR